MTQALQEIELSVVQGTGFNDLELRVTGDKTGWQAVGAIMKRYGDVSPITSWGFEPLTYDAADDVTIIKPYLTGAQTQQLPATQLYGLGSQAKVGLCVTDIKLVSVGADPGDSPVEVLRAGIRVYPSATQVSVA